MRIDVVITATNKPSLKEVLYHFGRYHSIVNSLIVIDFDRLHPSLDAESFRVFNKECNTLKYIFVVDQAYFNKSLALNVGSSFCTADYVLFCDADIKLGAEYIDEVKAQMIKGFDSHVLTPENVVESSDGKIRPAPGVCALNLQIFRKIEGYSSRYKGWGLEDMDFLHRLGLAGITLKKAGSGVHMSHEDCERTQNYHMSSVSEMREKNLKRFADDKAANVILGTLKQDMENINYQEY